MVQPPPPKPEPPGVRCPRCGSADSRVDATRRLAGGRIRRYRECECGHRFCTLEVPTNEAVKPEKP